MMQTLFVVGLWAALFTWAVSLVAMLLLMRSEERDRLDAQARDWRQRHDLPSERKVVPFGR